MVFQLHRSSSPNNPLGLKAIGACDLVKHDDVGPEVYDIIVTSRFVQSSEARYEQFINILTWRDEQVFCPMVPYANLLHFRHFPTMETEVYRIDGRTTRVLNWSMKSNGWSALNVMHIFDRLLQYAGYWPPVTDQELLASSTIQFLKD